jgi:hypothetical protein
MVSQQEHTVQNWIKDGQRIEARYMGVPVTGVVESSRVKYGGLVQYTVILEQPIQLPWRIEPTDRVLIDCDDISV